VFTLSLNMSEERKHSKIKIEYEGYTFHHNSSYKDVSSKKIKTHTKLQKMS